MKVRLTYCQPVDKVIEISPQDYRKLKSSTRYGDFFPDDALFREVDFADEAAQSEFMTYLEDSKKPC